MTHKYFPRYSIDNAQVSASIPKYTSTGCKTILQLHFQSYHLQCSNSNYWLDNEIQLKNNLFRLKLMFDGGLLRNGLSHRRSPLRFGRTAIRQTVPKKAFVEAKTSTLI